MDLFKLTLIFIFITSESQWCHWNFSLTKSCQLHYSPGVDSACNRKEYQEYFLGVNVDSA